MHVMKRERETLQVSAFAVSVAMWLVYCATMTLNPAQNGRLVGAAMPVSEVAGTVASVEPDREDVLWLARCIYSETKRPHEQELVAWVVRNRVETRYRGKSTYRDVVLDPFQFSAFNADSPLRGYYMSLDEHSHARGFDDAISIARWVMRSDASARPFSSTTRHFYSERSMLDGRPPVWAVDVQPVSLDRPVDPWRFRFYDEVV